MKRLGIPVGMLNDREKISRAGGEHGFIVFLVAPLVISAIGVFPTLCPCGSQLAANLDEWKMFWLAETSPPADEIARREADVQKVRNEVSQLFSRDTLRLRASVKRPSKARTSCNIDVLAGVIRQGNPPGVNRSNSSIP